MTFIFVTGLFTCVWGHRLVVLTIAGAVFFYELHCMTVKKCFLTLKSQIRRFLSLMNLLIDVKLSLLITNTTYKQHYDICHSSLSNHKADMRTANVRMVTLATDEDNQIICFQSNLTM